MTTPKRWDERVGPLVPWINTDPPGIYVDIDVQLTEPGSGSFSTAGGVYLTTGQARAVALELIELVVRSEIEADVRAEIEAE